VGVEVEALALVIDRVVCLLEVEALTLLIVAALVGCLVEAAAEAVGVD